jgi:rhamnosyltransferase
MKSKIMISIIVRTCNEQKYLGECLNNIFNQDAKMKYEVIVVDSGSVDNTLNIANDYPVKIINIPKADFTFGRSLNTGCREAKGKILVFISAHCIPKTLHWLEKLIDPILAGRAQYSFSRQIGRTGISNPSEEMFFKKYYPEQKVTHVTDYFVNNASAALAADCWQKFHFNEELTGLEDLMLGKQLLNDGGSIEYVPVSVVEHIHEETWEQIKNRFEREAVALKEIEHSLAIGFSYSIVLFFRAFVKDLIYTRRLTFRVFRQIIKYRSAQYFGCFRGGQLSREAVRRRNKSYFYP